MEGLVGRLTDPYDAVARAVMARSTLRVVPNMNPDGVFLGHLRTNAAGANLNREWREPSPEHSTEVFHVIRRMEATGLAMCIDVHVDEARSRSEERRVGEECGRKCRSRWAPYQ